MRSLGPPQPSNRRSRMVWAPVEPTANRAVMGFVGLVGTWPTFLYGRVVDALDKIEHPDMSQRFHLTKDAAAQSPQPSREQAFSPIC